MRLTSLIRLHVADTYSRLASRYNNVGENFVDMDDNQWDDNFL